MHLENRMLQKELKLKKSELGSEVGSISTTLLNLVSSQGQLINATDHYVPLQIGHV